MARHQAREAIQQRSLSRFQSHHYAFNISVKKAMKSMPKQALASMYKEIAQLAEKNVFKGVEPTFKHKKKVIKSFLFLKEKFMSDGTFDKLKSRLVANGMQQDKIAALFEDISSPTASLPFIFMIGSIAARERRHVKTMDIGGAYLNADISRHEILMELDATMAAILVQIDPSYMKFMRSDGTMVVMLQKALYGCIESAKLWYDILSVTLIEDGYVKNVIDPCVFNKLVNGIQCTVLIYVDDLFVTCKNLSMIDALESLLKAKFKEVSVHEGPVHSYLGMTWDFSVLDEVKVTMEGYTADLIKASGVQGVSATPATDFLFNTRDAPALEPARKEEFHSLVAKALYMAKRCRPDVLLPISFLTTRVQKPDEDDWSKLWRVLKYLNGTQDLGIILRPKSSDSLSAYIDASYGVHVDGKSHSGMVVSLGSGPLLVKSVKQKIVTKSSTEAELVALSDMCSIVIWSREFLIAQGEDPPPAVVYQDNQSTMAMIERGASTSERTRHIKVRYFWVKDRVDAGDVEIVNLPTEEMVADVLTKPMQGEKFKEFRTMILNWCY
jgi:histone deacetylase 1/2